MAKQKARKPAQSKSKAKKPAKKAVKRPKDGRPPGMFWPALSPYMTVRDAGASIEFYRKAFGFKLAGQVMKDAQGVVQHAGMMLGEAAIMFAPQGMSGEMKSPASSGATGSLSLYVYVPNVDRLAARAVAAGAKMRQAPADQFWGDRVAMFSDPDGYHWTFATNFGGMSKT